MKYLTLFLLFLSLSIIISCNNDDDQEESTVIECDKLTSREDALDLMEQVNKESLIDSAAIVENLIGEWGLIGILPGWVGFEVGQECFKLAIDSNTIDLEDLNSGEISTTEWELMRIEVNGYVGFYLETNEDVWNNRIGMQIFSDNIMFGSGMVDDGDTYIYEKIE